MSRITSVSAVVVAVVITWWVVAPTTAQSRIPDGVFVRDGDGTVWLVLNGQRVGVAIWSASDDDVRALPVGGQWAVMNDDGAIVAGTKPGWYAGGTSDTSASQPVVQSPIRTGAAASNTSSRSTPTPTPTPPAESSPGPTATPSLSPGAKAPVDTKNCPSTHPIKGNKSSIGERIYHVPGGATYASTEPEECFNSRATAEEAGYRAALR